MMECVGFQSLLIILRTLGRYLTRSTPQPEQAARHWGWQALQRELA